MAVIEPPQRAVAREHPGDAGREHDELERVEHVEERANGVLREEEPAAEIEQRQEGQRERRDPSAKPCPTPHRRRLLYSSDQNARIPGHCWGLP